MLKYVFFLGSHPAISATESLRVLAAYDFQPNVVAVHPKFLIASTQHQLPENFLSRLGGTDRIGEILAAWPHEPSPEDILGALSPLPDKWVLGLSMIEVSQNIKSFAANLKKLAREQGSRLKFVLPSGKDSQLNSAQVLFNALYRAPNSELTILQHQGTFYLARTIQIQNIQAYELRDTRRPARNARIGMLPPKLAQIMINIAASAQGKGHLVILDPFCGMGTILQEGWLMGHKMVGSDANDVMVEASQKNLQWTHKHFNPLSDIQPELITHDAQYTFPQEWNGTIDAIVTEPYLGTPLSSPLPPSRLKTYTADMKKLYATFFGHARHLLKADGHILFLLPAIRLKGSPKGAFELLPQSLIDEIQKSGYRKEQLLPEALEGNFSTTKRGTLLYSRPGAFVAREFTLWKKI